MEALTAQGKPGGQGCRRHDVPDSMWCGVQVWIAHDIDEADKWKELGTYKTGNLPTTWTCSLPIVVKSGKSVSFFFLLKWYQCQNFRQMTATMKRCFRRSGGSGWRHCTLTPDQTASGAPDCHPARLRLTCCWGWSAWNRWLWKKMLRGQHSWDLYVVQHAVKEIYPRIQCNHYNLRKDDSLFHLE